MAEVRMSVLAALDRWKTEGAISAAQHDAIAALVRKDRWSVFVELNALLYLGVVALVAGAGWTVTTYSARLGDVAILSTLTGAFAWSLYYCFARGFPYSQGQVGAPTLAFDYVLYLGCLVFAVDLGYIESRFHPFGPDWDHSLLAAAAVFFPIAYRFDNRLVLSLALSSLGAWFGVRVSHFGLLFSGSLRAYALVYGVIVAAAGVALYRAGIKKHFLEAYLHVAANVLFVALVSGVGAVGGEWTPYLPVTLALATVAIVQGVRLSWFAFVVYGVVYGYAALSIGVLRYMQSSFSGVLAYFVVSGSIVIVALAILARRFGRDA
jgi:predicted membrane protein DUF2157